MFTWYSRAKGRLNCSHWSGGCSAVLPATLYWQDKNVVPVAHNSVQPDDILVLPRYRRLLKRLAVIQEQCTGVFEQPLRPVKRYRPKYFFAKQFSILLNSFVISMRSVWNAPSRLIVGKLKFVRITTSIGEELYTDCQSFRESNASCQFSSSKVYVQLPRPNSLSSVYGFHQM